MGSLAGLLVNLGHRVSGSDVRFDPPMGPLLSSWGVATKTGFTADNLEPRPDLVVVGNVCRSDNPEAIAARELGLEVGHIASALQRFALLGRQVTVCAGTHGKTTTSSLVAFLLDAAGKQPGFFIGGVPNNFSQGFRAADEDCPFVIEGDEYDTAYFEKTPKFLHYLPHHAIITSVEHDHVDIYPTEDAYRLAFRHFVDLIPESGVLVGHAGDHNLQELLRNCRANLQTYAVEGFAPPLGDCSWVARDVHPTPDGGQDFSVVHRGVTLGHAKIAMSGLHNVANGLAALILCHTAYGVNLSRLLEALPTFTGTRRRQELLGRPGGVRVYDDFAHHPSAVAATLWGLRRRHTEGKLISVFEPRSATACRNLHQQEYTSAFEAADVVLLAPLGRTGLPADQQLDTKAVAAALRERGKEAEACLSIEAVEENIVSRARQGDTVALLSNGAFGGIATRLLQRLEFRPGVNTP